ncbi:MAG: outer-membrane lipoprotein carrier protein LolA [Treponema sp.]|nr:outer-membrane lipoprotein carrier protein LolA [Treponema sp.]MEE3435571.1 outer-membrane lipoprotein carrier protein LolA [Treponema sp.]
MKLSVKKSILRAFAAAILSAGVFAQGPETIITANEYFKSVSEEYGKIKDYQANANITIDKEDMKAKITYLQPDKVRFDFSKPEEQVIVFNGETLTIYLPGHQAVLTQNANAEDSDAKGNAANLATSEGLSLMRRYYTVSYETSQETVPLDEGSDEKVVRLVLWRRTTSEAFRYIKLSITPKTKLIRRIEAVTPADITYKIDFSDYEINQGLTAQRFSYDIPSAANSYDNFMF